MTPSCRDTRKRSLARPWYLRRLSRRRRWWFRPLYELELLAAAVLGLRWLIDA
ncbi:hypothetical protein GALL_234880 [mine drainage metagenome]|uniref:Uncharacterized protein n=1 Tax=mine drainage metagenome TaxID=410659 RepID=A0A1J5RYF8_9ZZZZ